ncbi:MAG: cyclic pyranopterin monophosphate synthase MoaC [Clostridiales bacterium]|nr:cyclic pyranopterin monophosphate synthase MoaC [Clostridiales bacterium]
MELTHLDNNGNARMVDVTDKDITKREAVAEGYIYLNEETLSLIKGGKIKKGDVFSVAKVAGIMAAKRTFETIPMCHPLLLTGVDMEFECFTSPCRVQITSKVRCRGETGVEMEALNAVSVAALTVYDMCKAVQKDMEISGIRLVSKSGGKSGDYKAD